MAGGGSLGHADPLRPFTTTAEVPAVGRFDPRYGGVRRVRRPPPLGLRVAVWVTAVLLLAGLAGLGIHRLRPSALGALEITTSPSPTAAAPATSTPTTSARGAKHPTAAVTETSATPTGATMEVSTAHYTVKVAAQAPCWVQATAPGSPSPVFAGTLIAGEDKTFSPLNGQVELLLGASRVTVSVLLAGSSAAAWTYTPTAAPFDLRFTSASV